MSEVSDAAPLIEARTLRKAARQLVDDDVKWLKDGLKERPLGRRMRDKAADALVDTVDEARDIAMDNKPVVAGTLVALIAWFLRRPIVRGIEAGLQRLKNLRG